MLGTQIVDFMTKKVILCISICVLRLFFEIVNTEKLTSATLPTDNKDPFRVT